MKNIFYRLYFAKMNKTVGEIDCNGFYRHSCENNFRVQSDSGFFFCFSSSSQYFLFIYVIVACRGEFVGKGYGSYGYIFSGVFVRLDPEIRHNLRTLLTFSCNYYRYLFTGLNHLSIS
jgi:hypothetical protein